MTVEQLIEKLREFPPYREVTSHGEKIIYVGETRPEQMGPYVEIR